MDNIEDRGHDSAMMNSVTLPSIRLNWSGFDDCFKEFWKIEDNTEEYDWHQVYQQPERMKDEAWKKKCKEHLIYHVSKNVVEHNIDQVWKLINPPLVKCFQKINLRLLELEMDMSL